MSLATAPVDTLEPEDPCRPQRVLVVEENDLVQAGLRAVLAEASWVASCLVASEAATAMQVVRRQHPQVVLVSASLGGRSGPQLCRWLKEQMPHIKVVVTAGEGRVPAAFAASLGAVGALSKHMPRGAIVAAVKGVAEGGKVFPRVPAPASQLSRRELDVLQHLASGLSNPETAATLNLSRHTVKQHTSGVYRKLGVRNRAEATRRAHELGLLVADVPRAG